VCVYEGIHHCDSGGRTLLHERVSVAVAAAAGQSYERHTASSVFHLCVDWITPLFPGISQRRMRRQNSTVFAVSR